MIFSLARPINQRFRWALLFAWAVMLPCLLASLTTQAKAVNERTDYIDQRSFLDDPLGSLTLADVMSRPRTGPTAFTPYTGLVSRGNSDSVLWLKVEMGPDAHAQESLVLVVQPAHLRQVDVFTQSADGSWGLHRTGTSVAYGQRPRPDVSFAVDLERAPPTGATVYLRLQSPTAMIPFVRVLMPDESVAVDTKLHMMLAAYSAGGVLFSCLALIAWRASKDPIWLLGALFDVSSAALSWLQMGFAGKYLLSDQPAMASALVPIIVVVHATLAYLFLWRLLKALDAPRWAYGLYPVALIAMLGVVGLMFMGRTAAALMTNNLLLLVCSAVGSVSVWFYSFSDKVLIRLYRLWSTSTLLYLLVYVLPILKISVPSQLSLYPLLPTNLFTVMLFTAIMARRLQMQLRESAQAEQKRQAADQQLKVEQTMHAETAGLLGMILHEVKNPLTSIRMATSTLSSGRPMDDADRAKRLANIQLAVDGIDDVLESCMAVDKLERGRLVLDPQPVEMIEFLRHWVDSSDEPGRITLTAPETLHAVVDMRLCLLLVRNLLDNATKYSPAGAPVECAVSRDEDQIVVRVTNPVGRVGAPDASVVFTKYYRAPQAMYLPGTGLGLYWVDRVITLIGGSVHCTTVSDQVRFEMRMPC